MSHGATGIALPAARRPGFPRPAILPFLLLLLLGVAAAGCAPVVKGPGAPVTEARLETDRLVMADGAALPLRHWMPETEPPQAILLALHGFNDYSEAFADPAKDWAAAGIATYAYDQRGFGRAPNPGFWPGTEALIDDLRTAARLLREAYPTTPLYILGESMGGAVAMTAATEPDPPTADGLILAAPAIWGRELQGAVANSALWFFAHTMPWLKMSGAQLQVQPSDNIAMLRALGKDPLVIKETRIDAIYGLVGLMDRSLAAAPKLRAPALVLYGAREEVIPGEAAAAMLHRLTPAPAGPRTALYAKGYHMLLRDLASAVVRQDIAAWVHHPDLPLPSRADDVARRVLDSEAEDLALGKAAE